MTTGPRRKKAPEQVRNALLESAMGIIARSGLAAASIQAVSTAAGVTKGALFYHFADKQALIDAVFADVLAALASNLEARMACDQLEHGRFTRAYVSAVFEMDPSHEHWGPLWVAMLADPGLRCLWTRWLNKQLEDHAGTDVALSLQTVRLTADGVWLADLSNLHIEGRDQLKVELIGKTLSSA